MYKYSLSFCKEEMAVVVELTVLKISIISLMSWLNSEPTIVGRNYFY